MTPRTSRTTPKVRPTAEAVSGYRPCSPGNMMMVGGAEDETDKDGEELLSDNEDNDVMASPNYEKSDTTTLGEIRRMIRECLLSFPRCR